MDSSQTHFISPSITGLGLITPLGIHVSETWEAILAGRFITSHSRVPGVEAGDRTAYLAARAANEAVRQAGWPAKCVGEGSTGLFVGTSKGPVERWITPPPSTSDNVRPSAGHSDRTFGLAHIAAVVARELQFGPGPRLTLSAACASGLHALIRAVMMIRTGEIRRAVVVAAESSVHPLFVGSFKRLGVLPAEGIGCRPMDETRDGFLISEAAAAVCLEGTEPENDDPGRIFARVDRFALGGDATHLTGADPQGATLMYLLDQVIGGRRIDLFHAHATGTKLNDPIELAAIESVTPPDEWPPAVYSHKGALGHSLGAAGMISIVINAMSHRSGIVPPNVRTRQPIATKRVRIDFESRRMAVRRSVAIATGFGGPTAVVSLANR